MKYNPIVYGHAQSRRLPVPFFTFFVELKLHPCRTGNINGKKPQISQLLYQDYFTVP
jgi:hypothetical protein